MANSPDDLIADRGQFHGKETEHQISGFVNLGLAWTAILQDHFKIQLDHPIPGHVVALMMVSLKCNRAARPFKINPDDYEDIGGYCKLAQMVVNTKGITGNGNP